MTNTVSGRPATPAFGPVLQGQSLQASPRPLDRHLILGHPAQLFVLFFTEMWERFSYYGMRALLVLYLISTIQNGGWGWSRAEAMRLYGWYSSAVYVTPLIGGYLADRYLGTRLAIVLGGFIIAAGHVSLYFGTQSCFYLGLTLIALGTGFFKPNIAAIVGQLYDKGNAARRDGGYTIFYMGVNAGAFFGITLCGYIGEKISWHYGFGLAGIFMILGAVQFWFSGSLFGDIGKPPTTDKYAKSAEQAATEDPVIVRDRLFVVGILSIFTIFFWVAYDQGGGSMTIFAADYTDRVLNGSSATVFKFFNTLVTVIPAAILSGLLVRLARTLGGRHWPALLLLGMALLVIWALSIWMLTREFSATGAMVPATWFGVLNSFFVVVLAPLMNKLWTHHWNPSGPVKFALGLLLIGVAFLVLAFGARDIQPGAKFALVGMQFLVLAKFLETIAELCISPVGLSFISKLAPARLFGLTFGFWFLNSAISAKLAGSIGAQIDSFSQAHSIAAFFALLGLFPVIGALLLVALSDLLIRKMHGVR